MSTIGYTDEEIGLALRKWESVKEGVDGVVVDDRTLDILSDNFKDPDGTEADVYFRHTSSATNPTGVGIRDRYILRLSDKGRAELSQHSLIQLTP